VRHGRSSSSRTAAARSFLRYDRRSASVRTRTGRDYSEDFPELAAIADVLAKHRVTLDSELVCRRDDGRPDFARLRRRLAGRTRSPQPVMLQIFDGPPGPRRLLHPHACSDSRPPLRSLERPSEPGAEPTQNVGGLHKSASTAIRAETCSSDRTRIPPLTVASLVCAAFEHAPRPGACWIPANYQLKRWSTSTSSWLPRGTEASVRGRWVRLPLCRCRGHQPLVLARSSHHGRPGGTIAFAASRSQTSRVVWRPSATRYGPPQSCVHCRAAVTSRWQTRIRV
jgi:hypothetical protein